MIIVVRCGTIKLYADTDLRTLTLTNRFSLKWIAHHGKHPRRTLLGREATTCHKTNSTMVKRNTTARMKSFACCLKLEI